MKNQTGKFAKISLIILLGMFLTCLHSTSAFAVDFITKKEFEAQKSPYQDYPLKILFKKLAESDASEKRIIRNTIILKQAFDRNMQEKIKAGLISYQKTFGTISNISKDNLKLWIPKTDSSISFYLGIDHIPLVNDNNYKILESNINKYAAVIYSLDNRVYQINISFLPAAPNGLYMQRENDKNIVGWKRPASVREPVGYKLFINEELFGQLKETQVKVPRTSGQVDEYYVKAVYKHGDSLIESDASDVQIDEITAKEVQQEILAWETYDRIVAALNPSDWQTGQKLLYDNQPFLSRHLNQERQQNTILLVAFFKDIDAGDRLIQVTPASVKSIESALIPYQSAAQKAKSMPTGLDVAFIPHLKINAGKEQIARLQTEQKQLTADQTYTRIVAALNPSEWQTAEKLLYDNQPFLSENLDQKHRQNTILLTAFFKDIDEGDRLNQAAPASVKSIESAMIFYQSAEKKAKSLPTGLDVAFLPRLKIDASQKQIASLQTQQKQLTAGQTYERIVAALNPSEWQTAEKLLYDNQPFLSENLDQKRQQNTALLVAFFKDIDTGDRLIKVTPASVKSIESALIPYQRAAQKATSLPTGLDVEFIPRLKINAGKEQLARLQTKQKQLNAGQTYNRIVAALNPSEWQTAEKLLYDNQPFLSENLDQKRRQNTILLTAFFKDIDEGDRLNQAAPASVKSIESAMIFYQSAAQKATSLPAGLDVAFLPRLKIDAGKEQIASLQAQQKQLAAGQTYDRIVAALNPSDWQTGQKLLYDNQPFLSENLDQVRKLNTLDLIVFFREIDEGDRLGQATPPSVKNLESALMFYQRAAKKAKTLPAGLDVAFLPRLKIDESQKRIALLQTEQKQLAAGQTYDRIVAALNPSDWQTAEKLLYDNQPFLSLHLDEERKQNTAGLIAFFKEIGEGDRFSTTTPASITNIESALMFYQRAATKAQALPASIDVEFIHRLKINANQEHLARLQIEQKQLAAGQTYDRILAALNPSEWQTAEKLLYDNQPFLSRHLDEERKQNTAGLIAFFREIDAGERSSKTAPASVQTLESALMFYQRAEKKAGALPAAIDVEFIYRLRIDESQRLLANLKADEQEFAAARNARATAVATPVKSATPEEIIDRKTALRGAMIKFKTRDYPSSFNHFEKVYSTQITSLKRSGNKSIRGLLSLPVRHRAEIIFLIALDRLKKENEDDEDLVKEGLEVLYESIDNGEGPWSIIPESKRRKIRRHIEKYGK